MNPKWGGKALSLRRLHQLALPVPKAWVVDGNESASDAEAFCLTEANSDLLAIRSSPEISAPGAYRTELAVPAQGELLMQSIKRVRASMQTHAAVGSVVVQHYVGSPSPSENDLLGVAHSRDPSGRRAGVVGEVFWGREKKRATLTPSRMSPGRSLRERLPTVFARVCAAAEALEHEYAWPVELEFLCHGETLFFLQARPLTAAGFTSHRWAVDLVTSGQLSQREALLQIDPRSLRGAATVAQAKGDVIAQGLPASPFARTGLWVRNREDLQRAHEQHEAAILWLVDLTPEDNALVREADAVILGSGGITSHAAVVCRAHFKPCVVAATMVRSNPDALARVTIDGHDGRVTLGDAVFDLANAPEESRVIVQWAQELSASEGVLDVGWVEPEQHLRNAQKLLRAPNKPTMA